MLLSLSLFLHHHRLMLSLTHVVMTLLNIYIPNERPTTTSPLRVSTYLLHFSTLTHLDGLRYIEQQRQRCLQWSKGARRKERRTTKPNHIRWPRPTRDHVYLVVREEESWAVRGMRRVNKWYKCCGGGVNVFVYKIILYWPPEAGISSTITTTTTTVKSITRPPPPPPSAASNNIGLTFLGEKKNNSIILRYTPFTNVWLRINGISLEHETIKIIILWLLARREREDYRAIEVGREASAAEHCVALVFYNDDGVPVPSSQAAPWYS